LAETTEASDAPDWRAGPIDTSDRGAGARAPNRVWQWVRPKEPRTSWWWYVDAVVALPWIVIVALRWFGQGTVLGIWTAAFSIWLLLPVWLLMVAAFVAKRRALGVVLLLIACVHANWVVHERGIARATPPGPRLTVFTANIYEGNRDIAATAPDIIRSHADIVLLQELRPKHLRKLEAAGAFDAYPYHVIDAENGAVGSGIWSRYPMHGTTLTCADHPMTEATVTFQGREISVFNAHPEAPVGTTEMHRWRAQLACVAATAKTLVERGPTIVAGDFNATLALKDLQRVLHAGLRDAQSERGDGLTGTYPVHHRLPPILRLDHVLHSHDFGAVSVHVGPARGSDHRQVVAVLALR
jgi:endonuclease/exonuclease/phosphatase (EEP) superfamily protein YafD